MKISVWKSIGLFNYLDNSNMNAVRDSRNDLPALKNDGRMYVYLSGNYFTQNKVIIEIHLQFKMLRSVLWK